MGFTSGLGQHSDTQHVGSAKRNAASGVCGLDGSLLVGWNRLPFIRVMHESHNNLMANVEAILASAPGSGAYVPATHSVLITNGVGADGYGVLYTMIPITPSASMWSALWLLRAYTNGVDGTPLMFIGFSALQAVNTIAAVHLAGFLCDETGQWAICTNDGVGAGTKTNITAPGQTSSLQVQITSTRVTFYVSGVSIGFFDTDLPSDALMPTASVMTTIGTSTTKRDLDIDYRTLIKE